MDIDVARLGGRIEELRNLVRALDPFDQGILELRSGDGFLSIRTHGRFQRAKESPEEDITVRIPYPSSNEYRSYSRSMDLKTDLTSDEAIIETQTKARPLGWSDDAPSFRGFQGQQLSPEEMRGALNFLLRLYPTAHVRGAVFNQSEILTTDGSSLHGVLFSTPLTSEPFLCGRGSLAVLQSLLSLGYQWALYGGLSVLSRPGPKRHNYGSMQFKLIEPSGIEVEMTSSPQYPAKDLRRGKDGDWVRVPIDDRAISYSVPVPEMYDLCNSTFRDIVVPSLTLYSEGEHLRYEVRSESDEKPCRAGAMSIHWASQMFTSRITLCPNRVRQVLKKTKDEYLQITIPFHPEFGFDYYEVSPIYLNTNAQHFALLAPMILKPEQDRIYGLLAAMNKKKSELRNAKNDDRRVHHGQTAGHPVGAADHPPTTQGIR